jgi:serine phosphatase RsbU (regulator of sigma subunit)/pSer/pThr/pTyr-binding forkhead associated (FHA) protein
MSMSGSASGPRLEVIEPTGRRVVQVDKPIFTIGRRTNSDLCILGREVSREHAEIVQDENRYVIRDRSSNGTYVNESAVGAGQTLNHGDSIRLGKSGDARLRFLVGEDSPGNPDTVSAVSAVHDLRQMAALFEGLRAMGSAHALDEVLAVVLDLTIEFTGAERGFVMLADPQGRLEYTLGRARGRVTLPGRTFETSRRIPEEVFTTGEARSVSDLLDGDMSSIHTGTIALGIRHVLCLPLRLARYAQKSSDSAGGQKRIGVLYLDSRQKGTLLSDTTRSGLETLATEAAIAIENARLYREEIEKLRLEQELNIAAQIQQALLPEPRYSGNGVEVAAVSVPCRAIGGDFLDYVELTARAFGFALGDVAGKGPSAALLTAAIQGVFSSRAPEGASPANTIASVNQAVIRRAVQARFVTMTYGVVDAQGRLTYCNGGHNPPLLIKRHETRRLEQGGTVLGLFPQATYDEETVQLEPGDVIVAFSDGVSESMNLAGDQYEESRIEACVRRNYDQSPSEILEALLADVRTFSEGTPQHDDLTALILKYSGS